MIGVAELVKIVGAGGRARVASGGRGGRGGGRGGGGLGRGHVGPQSRQLIGGRRERSMVGALGLLASERREAPSTIIHVVIRRGTTAVVATAVATAAASSAEDRERVMLERV